MSAGIYLSHCPGEHLAMAKELRQRLREAFPDQSVHTDLMGLDGDGEDDEDEGLGPVMPDPRLRDAVLLIALVGPFWLDGGSRHRVTPADREREQVRVDLATALRDGTPVLLLRLNGAMVPPAHQLPPALRPLAEGAAVTVAVDDPVVSLPMLMGSLQQLLHTPRQPRGPAAAAVPAPAAWSALVDDAVAPLGDDEASARDWLAAAHGGRRVEPEEPAAQGRAEDGAAPTRRLPDWVGPLLAGLVLALAAWWARLGPT